MAQLVENAVDKSALVEVRGGARIPKASHAVGVDIAITKFRGGSICITPQNLKEAFPKRRLLVLVLRVCYVVLVFGSLGCEPRRAAVAAAGRGLDRAQRGQALVRAANRGDGRPVLGQVFGARSAQRRAFSARYRPHHALPDKTHHAQGRFARSARERRKNKSEKEKRRPKGGARARK